MSQHSDDGRNNQRLERVRGDERVEAERNRLRTAWPDEYADGSQCGFGKPPAGERLKGGYPIGFNFWEPDRRNAWWAGFNEGYVWRKARDETNEARR
jgi:hypothetical protein